MNCELSIVNCEFKLLLLLSVISIRAMLAHVMLLYEKRIHCCLRINGERDERHLGALLHHLGIVHRVRRVLAPRERTVILYEHRWSVVGIDAQFLELADDNLYCLQLILRHLRLNHCIGARNILVEIVGMSCTDIRDSLTCLCPRSSVC